LSEAPVIAAKPLEPRPPARSHALMDFLMLITTFCWAANIVAGKLVLHSMGALALSEVRVMGATVLFAPIFFFARGRAALRLTRREWGFLALTAFFGITLNQLFFIGGIGRTSAAHSGLIVALGPVMVLILSCALHMEALTTLKTVGALVALTGVGFLTTGKGAHTSGATLLGDALLFVGGAAFAYYTILLKEVADRYDALTLNTLVFGMGAVFMLPFSARAIAEVNWGALSREAWWGIAFMVILGSVISYLIYAFALTELTASRVAAFAYLQPVIAAGLGIWMLGEFLTSRVVIGGALILLGVYLAERERGEEKLAPQVPHIVP
jgi:drug/metabolite transporter (DMT)-like permease